MKNKLDNTVLTIIIVVIVFIGGYSLYQKGIIAPSNKKTLQQQFLTKASDDLNNTNIDSIDNELNENTFETSSY